MYSHISMIISTLDTYEYAYIARNPLRILTFAIKTDLFSVRFQIIVLYYQVTIASVRGEDLFLRQRCINQPLF